MAATHFKNTTVYKLSFSLAMEIYEISKSFPKEEKYSLTDQIRRCTRSVSSSIAEAYRKRQYPAHFVSKISDADMENAETSVWLDFSLACTYIQKEIHGQLIAKNDEIGRLLNHMIQNPGKY
ncbi:MAG: four helix bundle protein [Bacteroidia bacterium]